MKVISILALYFFVALQAKAQYYYLDIIGTKQTNQQFQKIRQNNLQKISATSYEANNAPSTDFVLEQTIDLANNTIITRSASVNSTESFFLSQFKNNRLFRTVDSSSSAINTVLYTYDMQGKLLSTHSSNKDFDGTYDQEEDHFWQYNANGQPQKMLKIKNNVDTTIVNFSVDDKGNVTDEKWIKNNRTLESYFYYYNAANKLTDIVRYNRKARQMLPDFMFEYDTAGLISQMTQIQGSNANYLTWRYFYNSNGMKEKEFVFNKKKDLLGKIEYSYK